jgi:threonine/homoserine/homoserine lactone efflux protein
MSYLPTLAAIAGVYLVAVASPGPNFLLISQLALTGRTRQGLTVAAGIASGSLVWAMLAMAGVAALLAHVGWLYMAIRLGGAAYLIWFGAKLLLSARRSGDTAARMVAIPATPLRAYRAGLVTNLTNPKAGAFWTSVFSSMYPVHAPVWFAPMTLAIVVCISGGWYALIAFFFATDAVQRRYLRLRRTIDGLCGTLLVGLGVHLAASR